MGGDTSEGIGSRTLGDDPITRVDGMVTSSSTEKRRLSNNNVDPDLKNGKRLKNEIDMAKDPDSDTLDRVVSGHKLNICHRHTQSPTHVFCGGGVFEQLTIHQARPRLLVMAEMRDKYATNHKLVSGINNDRSFILKSCCIEVYVDIACFRPPIVYIAFFVVQRLEKLKNVDLTNAGSMITYEVAQSFLRDGTPSTKELNRIIERSAIKMRFMRDRFRFHADDYTNLELHEMLLHIQKLYNTQGSDGLKTAKLIFPERKSTASLIFASYYGSVFKNDDYAAFQVRVESRLNSHGKAAVSLSYNLLTITGCFDVVVSAQPLYSFCKCILFTLCVFFFTNFHHYRARNLISSTHYTRTSGHR